MGESRKAQNVLIMGPTTVFGIYTIIIFLLPFFFQLTNQADYLQYIVTRIMILGIYALSFDLVHGITGMLSFGQAGLFGGGAYVTAILFTRSNISEATLLISGAIIGGAILAWAMGILASRIGGLAVFLVTFAFVEVVRLFALSDPLSITNGENGIAGIARGHLFGLLTLKSELHFYYFTLLLLVFTFLSINLIKNSPMGDVFFAIRENSERVPFLGYSIRKYQIVSFVLSGAFAGLSGCLMAMHEGSVSPDILHWFFSADALLYVVFGGPGTLIGPVLATTLVVGIQEILSDILTTHWMIFLGLSFIALIVFLPNGLYPLMEKTVLRKKAKSIPDKTGNPFELFDLKMRKWAIFGLRLLNNFKN
jgi:branched-chain amino acid transport system permease protein